MKVLAIDPGKEGGLAIYGDGLIIEPMPVSKEGQYLWGELAEFLRAHPVDMAFVELQVGRPGQNSSATFTQGMGYGGILATLSFLKIPYQLITPKDWSVAMHAGITPVYKAGKEKKVKDTKAMSRIAVERLFPGHDFRATPKSKVPHEGLVDAALIALYGYRRMHA